MVDFRWPAVPKRHSRRWQFFVQRHARRNSGARRRPTSAAALCAFCAPARIKPRMRITRPPASRPSHLSSSATRHRLLSMRSFFVLLAALAPALASAIPENLECPGGHFETTTSYVGKDNEVRVDRTECVTATSPAVPNPMLTKRQGVNVCGAKCAWLCLSLRPGASLMVRYTPRRMPRE